MTKQPKEVGSAQEIADQRRGVTVGVVKVSVTMIERWEAMARELEGLPSRDNALETVPSTVDRTTPQASSTD